MIWLRLINWSDCSRALWQAAGSEKRPDRLQRHGVRKFRQVHVQGQLFSSRPVGDFLHGIRQMGDDAGM